MTAAQRRFALALLATLGLAAAASAQAPALDTLEVALWPEYDQPSVLVMYKGTLSPDTALPAEVRLSIPASVGPPHAVAYRDMASGNLMLAGYQTAVEGAWQHLDIATPSPAFRVEYYAPLSVDEQARAFTLEWPGTTAVGELTYDLQQPAGSDHLTVTPEATITVVEETLAYHRGSLGPLAAGQRATVQVSYKKTDPRLTTQILQSQAAMAAPPPPPPPAPEAAPARTPAPEEGMDSTMWISLVLGLVLLGALVALAWSWIRKRT